MGSVSARIKTDAQITSTQDAMLQSDPKAIKREHRKNKSLNFILLFVTDYAKILVWGRFPFPTLFT